MENLDTGYADGYATGLDWDDEVLPIIPYEIKENIQYWFNGFYDGQLMKDCFNY